MTKKNETPELIEDNQLDATNGGIALVLPSVQKVREAANATPAASYVGSANGGVWKATNGGQ